LTTQACARTALDPAVAEIGALDAMTEPPRVLAIEETSGAAGPKLWS